VQATPLFLRKRWTLQRGQRSSLLWVRFVVSNSELGDFTEVLLPIEQGAPSYRVPPLFLVARRGGEGALERPSSSYAI
jgi:hypothetical protein